MSSTFYGLEIGKSGLFASQKTLEVIGNNIANADTEGYTRQRVNLSSVASYGGNCSWTPADNAVVGCGVNIDGIQQIRNEYYDTQYRNQYATLSDLSAKAKAYGSLETVLNESSTTGVQTALQTLYDDFQKLSGAADSKDIRTLVREDAKNVTDTFQYYSKQLVSLQDDQDKAINVSVNEVNDLVDEISKLNTQIGRCQVNNSNANDLLDKRNLALDKLSGYVDISYSEGDNRAVSIYMGKNKIDASKKDDYCLLDGSTGTAYKLTSTQNKANYYGTADQYHNVTLVSKNGNTVNITGDSLTGGSLKGNFDNRDGDTDANPGIAHTLNQLDTLVRGIVSAYNEVHKNGYGIPSDDNGNVSKTNMNFFDDQNGDLTKVNANNFALSSDVLASVNNIAASSQTVDLTATNTQKANNENALKLVKVSTATNLGTIGSIDEYLQSMISSVAVASSHYTKLTSNQQTIVDNITDSRQETSGVSTNEETTNIIAAEKSFSAASHVITTLNDMLDTLLNMVR